MLTSCGYKSITHALNWIEDGGYVYREIVAVAQLISLSHHLKYTKRMCTKLLLTCGGNPYCNSAIMRFKQ